MADVIGIRDSSDVVVSHETQKRNSLQPPITVDKVSNRGLLTGPSRFRSVLRESLFKFPSSANPRATFKLQTFTGTNHIRKKAKVLFGLNSG